MARPIMLGNGRMLVGLNNFGEVHDFYYPYVGYENHLSSKTLQHKVGVWVDGKFSWIDNGNWRITMKLEDMALIGVTKAVNEELQVVLEFHDFVDSEHTAFIRNVHVVNKANERREIRVFFHQVFQIAESTRGDSAIYMPGKHVVLNYKGKRNFLIAGEHNDGSGFDQFGIGNYGIEGKEGTFKDAEDGQLSGNTVEHGRVDSAIGFNLNVEPHSSGRINYWVAVGQTRDDAIKLHQLIKDEGVHARHQKTQQYWADWLKVAEPEIMQLDPKYRAQVIKSLFIMKSHIDVRGAVIASGDSQMLNYSRDYYSYFWPRDGAFVLWPLIRLGFRDEPKAFFEFARDALSPGGYLMHKYLPDGSVGSTWHPAIRDGQEELPIQEDETAIVVFMLGEYLTASNDEDFVGSLYKTFVRPAMECLDRFTDESTGLPHPSFDLWEEKFLTTTYTSSVVYAALLSAVEMAKRFEYPDDAFKWESMAESLREKAHEAFFNKETNFFQKGFAFKNDMLEYDSTIDMSSLYGAALLGLYDLDDPYVKQSALTIHNTLMNSSPVGGMPRYENDYYHRINDKSKGNPWFVTSYWYAQYLIEVGREEKAKEILDWSMQFMHKTGVLSEQIHAETGESVSVAPLIWSQAEFINTVFDLHSAREIPRED